MMTGLLDAIYGPEPAARRQVTDAVRAAVLANYGKDIFSGMSEADREQVAANALGGDRDTLGEMFGIVINRCREERRRDDVQARIWQIEADLAARVAPQLAAEHDRALGRKPTRTKDIYRGDERHFADFCASLGVPAMPASAGTLAKYMLDGRMNWPLLRRRLTAIKHWHHRNGRLLPTADPLVRIARRIAKQRPEDQQAKEQAGNG